MSNRKQYHKICWNNSVIEMPLIDSEINLILTWSADCVIASNTAANQEKKLK